MDINFNTILLPLSAALGLSLTVERILEFISNLWERVVGLMRTRRIPAIGTTKSAIDNLEKLYRRAELDLENEKESEKNEKKRKNLLDQLAAEKNNARQLKIKSELDMLDHNTAWHEQVDPFITLVEPANDPDDGKTLKRFVLQLLGFALAIFLVHYSGVKIFSNFIRALQLNIAMPVWLDFLFSGLLIGAGSGPLHTLVRFVTTRKMTFARETESEEQVHNSREQTLKGHSLLNYVKNPAEETWTDIPYFGGVDSQILEGIHQREKDPDMIVYHHTGIHSSATFEDIVRVIKHRTDSGGNHWLTAYNCVILADGTVRPFCRWDRYGNHTSGYNRRSLGLAFNGNFESDPKIPYSNPDGQKGILVPSEVQLKAGARIVALWVNLYPEIQLDFKKNIVAHNQLAGKACPGNRFPYSQFEDLITYYMKLWENSETIQRRISEYRLKSYLYV